MTVKSRKVVWNRAHHEEFAIEAVESARRELPSTHDCSTTAVYATVRANRDIARARAHLASIGGHDSARTMKLWSVVDKQQRAVDLSSDRIARCVLKCQPGGILGRARRRR